MYSSAVFFAAIVSTAIAQSTTVSVHTSSVAVVPSVSTVSTAPYENPFTSYLTMTNSLGVITGMPSVITSQPAVVTSQPVSPTLPTLSGYVYGNGSTTSTTLKTSTSSAMSSTGSSTGSSTASATIARATGGAVVNQIAGAGAGLVIMAIGFSML